MSAVTTVTSTPPSYPTINSSATPDITLPQISTTSSLAQNTANTNDVTASTSSPIDPNPADTANAPAQPVTYTALANANNSTIRGTNLNIQA